jgi:hypothetical protein
MRARIPLLPLLLAFAPCLGGCASIRGSERSTVSTSQVFASAYWFRGVPRSLQAVTQGDLVVDTPLADGSTLSLVTWYNMQLTNRTGDAAFPAGNGGQMTEIDMVLDYATRIGRLDVSAGGIAYTFPQVGPSTKEAYLGATVGALGLDHTLTAYYDVDRLDDYYLQFQAKKSFQVCAGWSVGLAALIGLMGDDQAASYFGIEESGVSDLLVTASLTRAFDENTSVFLELSAVDVPDEDLADALRASGLDASGLWVAIGAGWGL